MAHVAAQYKRPCLVLVHNKTLTNQLYTKFKKLFPHNAIEYFVSYYDYYQPEAYIPSTDTLIDKDSMINEEIDRMRHSATRSLLERDDVLVVASVSCIYGIGASEVYQGMTLELRPGNMIDRETVLKRLVDLLYERNDFDFHRGCFRVRGDVVEVFPAYEEEHALRLEWFGDELEAIREVDPLRGTVVRDLAKIKMFPASHYVTTPDRRAKALVSIRAELLERLQELKKEGKLLEAQRLEQRTSYDLEMLEQTGIVTGIENYSRHLSGRAPGEAPPCLLDYFPDDFLLVIDESHQTVSQVRAMYRGDRARKETLVEHGFRLPSALDNRPLKFEEFEGFSKRCIYVSATPADYEFERTEGVIVEQIIRPTGLCDPIIDVRPVGNQIDDLLEQIQKRIEKDERVLVTTLTKRMSEDLAEYVQEAGIKARYIHSDIDTIERMEIIRDLRKGEFDALIGINLLREGLDLPEVSLVAILDADKEGFLRSERALIQTIGRAARNINGTVIMYADKITKSMKAAIDETSRRREKQDAYNKKHNITPQSVKRSINDLRQVAGFRSEISQSDDALTHLSTKEAAKQIKSLKKEMYAAAEELDFEKAAELRDQLSALQQGELGMPVSKDSKNDKKGQDKRRRLRRNKRRP